MTLIFIMPEAMTRKTKLKMTTLVAKTILMTMMVMAMMMTMTMANREGEIHVLPIDLKYFYVITFGFFNI